MLPRIANIEIMRSSAIAPVVTWRNLADTILSFDDHVGYEGTESAAGTFTYIGDRDRYLAMPQQARFQFLIRHMVPWYIGFYLAWRAAKAPLFMHYEDLVDDPAGYFGKIFNVLSGSVDRARLDPILGKPIPNTHFNVGRPNRALERFSDETKALLEETLLQHYGDLSQLIEELPWRRAVGAGSP
jgi:hypothetical protein